MAKKVTRPPDTTSYNRYVVSSGGPNTTDRVGNTSRVSGISSDSLRDYILDNQFPLSNTESMSPYYLYSVKEVAVILKKAEDTIRKESQRTSIGTHKAGRYWFNSKQVQDLKKSFAQKRKNYLRRKQPEEETLLYALFERLTKMEQLLSNLLTDRNRFHNLLWEWLQQISGRLEDVERRSKK